MDVVDIDRFLAPRQAALNLLPTLKSLGPWPDLGVDVLLYQHFELHRLGFDRAYRRLADADGLRRVIGGRRFALLLDNANEGAAYTPHIGAGLDRIAREFEIPHERLLIATTNEAFQRRLKACERVPAAVKTVRFVHHHHWLTEMLRIAPAEGLPDIAHRVIERGIGGRRRVLCLNSSARAHRYALVYLLAHHPRREEVFVTLQKGNYAKFARDKVAGAMGMFDNNRDVPDFETLEAAVHGADLDESEVAFQSAGQFAKSVEAHLYERTLTSAVTETEMSAGRQRRFTEKSIKPLMMGQPIVVFGNPRTLPLLKELGLDVFDDWLDGSYDAIVDPGDRFVAAWTVLKSVLEGSPDWLERRDVRDRLHANVTRFEGSLLAEERERTRRSIVAALTPSDAADRPLLLS